MGHFHQLDHAEALRLGRRRMQRWLADQREMCRRESDGLGPDQVVGLCWGVRIIALVSSAVPNSGPLAATGQ